MIFARGGVLGTANIERDLCAQLQSGTTFGVCVRCLDDEPERALYEVLVHPRVCLTTSELLEAAGFTLEHTQEGGESTHWTAWLQVPINDDEDQDVRLARARATIQGAFRGPVSKEEAHERAVARDLRGLQPPDGST